MNKELKLVDERLGITDWENMMSIMESYQLLGYHVEVQNELYKRMLSDYKQHVRYNLFIYKLTDRK